MFREVVCIRQTHAIVTFCRAFGGCRPTDTPRSRDKGRARSSWWHPVCKHPNEPSAVNGAGGAADASQARL